MHRGDFEQLLPKMPDRISDRMEAVIEKCITTDGNIKSKAHGRRIAPVAVACAVILLAGGTVYAAGHLAKRLMTEKEGDHGVLVSVVTEDSSEKETEESAAEEYKSFEMAFGTKPDGMDEYKNAEGKLPAIAVCGPFGAVKEQCSGLYAQTMADRSQRTSTRL